MNYLIDFFTTNTGEIESKKLIVTVIIAIFTAVLSIITSVVVTIINSNRNKKTTYINVITSNRISWMQNLKVLVDSFIRKTETNNYSPIYFDLVKKLEYFQELSKIRNEIFLQLNYKGYIDNKIMNFVNEIYYKIEILYEIEKLSKEAEASQKIEYIFKHYGRDVLNEFLSSTSSESKEINLLVEAISSGSNIPKELQELVKRRIESFNQNYRTAPRKLSSEIEMLHNELIMYTQIYLKLEWNRVKEESKGNLKSCEDRKYKNMVDEMVKEYDLKLFDFNIDKLPQYLK